MPVAEVDARIELGTVSLVCVETRRHALAIAALQRCMRQASFGECLLLSPQAPALPDGIRHVSIPDITSIAGYSDFMVRQLGGCFAGKHALVVQWDGFILDAKRWNARFLDFDYIGAPWPDPQRTVGNGGFSLRSRRLCEALGRLQPASTHPEDLRICVDLRPQLESLGIAFAPSGLAETFAWEAPEPPFGTFGFHGLFNFHRVMPEADLIDFVDGCDDGILFSIPARRLLKNAYGSGMQEAARVIHRRRMTGSLKMRIDAMKLKSFARLREWIRA